MLKKPNILEIITDQQRVDTIAAHGNPFIRTPAIDSIAARGTSFRRAYTPAPVCGPARTALACGMAPHETWQSDNLRNFRPNKPDYGKLLRDAGYQTVLVGSTYGNHADDLAGYEEVHDQRDEYPAWFRNQGIDHVILPTGRNSEYYYVPQFVPYPEKYTKTHWIADHGVDFLSRRDTGRPFYLGLHFSKPHPPFTVPYPWHYLYRSPEVPAPIRPSNFRDYQSRANRYQAQYKWMADACTRGDDMFLKTVRAAYYSLVSYVDSQIGRVLDALGPERENTLIVFTADHGEMLGDYGCVGKRSMLEGSARVPLIAALPGFLPEGEDCRVPASLIDIFATYCAVAGIEVPSESRESTSLASVANMQPGDRLVFTQHSRKWNGQYYATDGEHSYFYSAADRKEWHFQIDDSLDQGPILPMDDRAGELKSALIQRHKDDKFSLAVEDGDWKVYDTPAMSTEARPDHGLLWAEPADRVQAAVDSLGPGYARTIANLTPENLIAENLVPPTEEEKRVLLQSIGEG
jgi:arylsulfatase A-like enzyme